jgi:F0F1-type ATP synthase assembly protein I
MATPSPQPGQRNRQEGGSAKPKLTSARALGIGLELGTAIAGLTILGYFLDEYFDTEPTLTMIGCGLGLVGGVYNVIREVQRLSR